MVPTLEEDPEPVTDSEREKTEDEPTDGDVSSTVQTPSGSVSSRNGKVAVAARDDGNEDTVDVFDGYSYKARHSVNLDEDEDDEDRLERNGSRADGDVEELLVPLDTHVPGEASSDSESDVSIKVSAQFRPRDSIVIKVPSMDEGSETPREVDGALAELASNAAEVVAALNTPLPASPELDGELAELTSTTAELAALNTPLPASPTGSFKAELAATEPVLQRGVEEARPPIRDLVYEPSPASPAPSVRFDPITVVQSKPSRFAPFKRSYKKRREKTGVANFDEGMDLADEETDVPRGKGDDDDWDLVEAPGREETEINGPRGRGGTNLFARGVVDRYRLSVFKRPTPTRSGSRPTGIGLDSQRPPITSADSTGSPTPPEGKKRGRTPGLSLRKSKFLRAKSPIGSSPTPSVRKLLSSPANSNKGAQRPTGSLTPSSRGTNHSMTIPVEHSLKSKSSALSRESTGTPGSSGASVNDETSGTPPTLTQSASEIASGSKDGTLRGSKPLDEHNKQTKNFNKKMKVGAEKVMSLFASPKS